MGPMGRRRCGIQDCLYRSCYSPAKSGESFESRSCLYAISVEKLVFKLSYCILQIKLQILNIFHMRMNTEVVCLHMMKLM